MPAFIGKRGYKKEAQQLINAIGPDATAKTGSAETPEYSVRNPEPVVNKKCTLSDCVEQKILLLYRYNKCIYSFQNGKNRPAPTVLYEKSIGDKSYYVVQAVPDTKAKILYSCLPTENVPIILERSDESRPRTREA